jgi:hypothetical protein
MLSIKQLNAGQVNAIGSYSVRVLTFRCAVCYTNRIVLMSVCPDYVLCSEDVVDAFIQECRVV